MPYKRIGRTIYTKATGRWKKKQTAKNIPNAKKALKLLEGLEHGSIQPNQLKKHKSMSKPKSKTKTYKRKYAKKRYAKALKKIPKKKRALGKGGRFHAIEMKAKKYGARNPAAVAATAGRKAHGQRQMTKWAVAGKRRKGHPRTNAQRRIRHKRLTGSSKLPRRGTGRGR